ncbi:MAG TPA: FIST N-terminal domain-containing protein [Stellaceae bacterium]|nr:FIST N-terminal domain-containing protein [Stellaceae bacterium]
MAAPRFAAAHAAADDWAAAASSCADQLTPLPDGANLGFVYASEALAGDLPQILPFLRQRTRIADWVGSVGLGVCASGQEYFGVPALVVLAAALPPGGYELFGPQSSGAHGPAVLQSEWLRRVRPMLGIVHGDPRDAAAATTVATLARDASLFLVGGLAAAAGAPLQIAGRVVEGGLSGVLLAPDIPVITGMTQGCSPIGPTRRISEARDNIIMAIDDRPALEVFKEDIGELLSRDLKRVAGLVFVAFPVAGSDTGDYLVRNLVAIDVQRQWLAVAHAVANGDPVLFCRRDPASAATDLQRMLADLKRRAGGTPRAGLYFSCVARGPNLFGESSQELRMICDTLGAFPLAGFFGNGEIAHDRLYGYTGVLALFL